MPAVIYISGRAVGAAGRERQLHCTCHDDLNVQSGGKVCVQHWECAAAVAGLPACVGLSIPQNNVNVAGAPMRHFVRV